MAEPSVDPLVPHLFLLSLTLFPLPPLCPLPRSLNLMVWMDSVVHHDLFAHLCDGPAAALRWPRGPADLGLAHSALRLLGRPGRSGCWPAAPGVPPPPPSASSTRSEASRRRIEARRS